VNIIAGSVETIEVERIPTMSGVIQKKGFVRGLFSSALFCLWLSTASLVVWLDLGPAADAPTAGTPASQPVPAVPGSATPAPGSRPDAA
jgi:hypothetical protein